jgi:hypothetical protein
LPYDAPVRSGLVVITIFAWSCESHRARPIFESAGEDDLIVAVVESETGELETIDTFSAKEKPPELQISTGDELHFFLLRDGELRTLEGQSFGEGLEARIEIHDAARGSERGLGRCGRCQGTSASAPQIFYAGDSCALPDFAAYEGDGERGAIAARLRIGVEGDCGCAKYEEDLTGRFPTFSLLDVEGDRWPHDAVAVTALGAAGLFGEHHSVIVRPNGERAVAEDATSPFEGIGPPLSAAGTSSETFWVAVLNDDKFQSTHVFDAGFNELAPVDLPPDFSAHRFHALENGQVIALGKISRTAVAYLCNNAPPTDCRSITPRIELLGVTFTDATISADGILILAAFSGLLFLDAIPQTEITESPCTSGQLDCSGRLEGGVRFRAVKLPESDFVQTIGIAGRDRLLVCTHQPTARLFSIDLDASIFTRNEVFFDDLMTPRSEHCGRFSDDGDSKRMIFGSTYSLLIPPVGAPIVETSSNLRGAETRFGHLISWTGETPREVFVDQERVYGDPLLEEARIIDMLEDEDRVLALRSDGKIDIIGEFQKEPARLMLPSEVQVTSGAIDLQDRSLVLGLYGPNGPYLGKTGLTLDTVATLTNTGLNGGVITALEAVAPATFVLLTSNHEAFVLEGDQLTKAELESVELRALAAVPGRAWITGANGAFFELNPFSKPPRARRIEVTRETQTHVPVGSKPYIVSALGLCADDVLIGAPAELAESRNARGSMWELTSATPCAAPDLDRCVIDADRVFARSTVIAGFPSALAGDRRVATAAFSGGQWSGGTITRLGIDGHYRYPEQFVRAALAPWGDFYYATLFGRLVRGRLAR